MPRLIGNAENTSDLTDVSGTLGTANGGTGATTTSDARTSLGLGTAATTAATDYATAAQGSTADSAVQPGDDANTLGSGDATDGYVLTADGIGGVAWEAATGGSAINNVVEDLSPQLGGSLDVNGQSIVSVSAGNITITPDTTGKIILDGLSWPNADGSADQVLKTDGSGNLSFVDQSGGGGVSDLEHSNSVSTAETISSGNHRFYVGPISFTNTVTIAGKMLVFDGLLNTTGTINTTGTLHVRG